MATNATQVEQALNGVLEELADIEHQRWAHWQKYMHSKGTKNPDGSLVIPSDLVALWESQIITSYSDLTEKEKQSDREQVLKYLPTVIRAIAGEGGL